MVEFVKETLEATKYADLVKLAKLHDVYRRYAPKTEIIGKLMALCEYPLETLNDVSMPSFMENDETDLDEAEDDTENQFSQEVKGNLKGTNLNNKPSNVSYSSPRVPLLDKEKNLNCSARASQNDSQMTKSRSSTPHSLRKSLAGPAKPGIRDTKLKRQGTFEVENDSSISASSNQSTTRRLTRQRTFDVEEKSVHQMKREGTFDIEKNSAEVKKPTKVKKKSSAQILRREGTFEITEVTSSSEEKHDTSQSFNLRREGTFEVENTSISKQSSRFSNSKTCASLAVLTPKAKATSNRLSQCRQSARTSLKSPYPMKRVSVATPSSVKSFDKSVCVQSVPRRFITSRVKPSVELSPGNKSQATKSKVQSVINQIEQNKVEVSAKKIAEATGEKPVLVKKIPDFNAIHKRMFGKMESIVDSRQKVLDKANSMQKSQQKCGNSKRSPANTRVVRKLLSPKAGKTKLVGAKSKLPSPKSKLPTPKSKLPTLKSKLPTPQSKLPTPQSKLPTPQSKLPSPRSKLATPRARAAFQHVASEYASNIVCIQKRPSVGSFMPGVSKLQSPKFEAKGKSTTHFGFVKTEPMRKEKLKASVMGKKPTKRNSPMAKAKQALQSVRLNKRFELQMKHRMAQQEQSV